MPPKPVKANQPNKKTEQKKKEKVVEDKTFGLKNKKGTKQQKFIQQVQKQVHAPGNKTAKQLEKEKEDLKKKKDDKKKELLEITNLFKPVQQIAAKGVDPKSILCAYFKQGLCAKGTKCKFSHDLNIERKGEKRSAYVDMRDKNETSANWDEATLLEVVETKLAKEKNTPTTEIICRFFLDSVEEGKYGWFWECPNGEKCIYKHALPPGFVLKKDKKKLDKGEEISLEDLIERQRAALGFNTTKVTLETFLAWKKKKLKEREEQLKKDTDKKKSDYKSGKEGGISGREMFTFNPDLAIDEYDAEEGDAEFDFKNIKCEPEDGEEHDEEKEEIHYKEINFSSLIDEYVDVDSCEGRLSVAAPDRMDILRQEVSIKIAHAETNSENKIIVNGESAEESCEGAVAIDEDLFGGDDEDLDELEDQLEEMTIDHS